MKFYSGSLGLWPPRSFWRLDYIIERSKALHCVSDALTDESEGCLAEHGSLEWRPAAECKRAGSTRENQLNQQDVVPPDLPLRSERIQSSSWCLWLTYSLINELCAEYSRLHSRLSKFHCISRWRIVFNVHFLSFPLIMMGLRDLNNKIVSIK